MNTASWPELETVFSARKEAANNVREQARMWSNLDHATFSHKHSFVRANNCNKRPTRIISCNSEGKQVDPASDCTPTAQKAVKRKVVSDWLPTATEHWVQEGLQAITSSGSWHVSSFRANAKKKLPVGVNFDVYVSLVLEALKSDKRLKFNDSKTVFELPAQPQMKAKSKPKANLKPKVNSKPDIAIAALALKSGSDTHFQKSDSLTAVAAENLYDLLDDDDVAEHEKYGERSQEWASSAIKMWTKDAQKSIDSLTAVAAENLYDLLDDDDVAEHEKYGERSQEWTSSAIKIRTKDAQKSIGNRRGEYPHNDTKSSGSTRAVVQHPLQSLEGTRCSFLHCAAQGANLRCSSCRNVRYCSFQCQKNDWGLHRHMCTSVFLSKKQLHVQAANLKTLRFHQDQVVRLDKQYEGEIAYGHISRALIADGLYRVHLLAGDYSIKTLELSEAEFQRIFHIGDFVRVLKIPEDETLKSAHEFMKSQECNDSDGEVVGIRKGHLAYTVRMDRSGEMIDVLVDNLQPLSLEYNDRRYKREGRSKRCIKQGDEICILGTAQDGIITRIIDDNLFLVDFNEYVASIKQLSLVRRSDCLILNEIARTKAKALVKLSKDEKAQEYKGPTPSNHFIHSSSKAIETASIDDDVPMAPCDKYLIEFIQCFSSGKHSVLTWRDELTGKSALHVCASHDGSVEVQMEGMKKFMTLGAKDIIDLADNVGNSSLHYTALANNGICTTFLLENNASAVIMNNSRDYADYLASDKDISEQLAEVRRKQKKNMVKAKKEEKKLQRIDRSTAQISDSKVDDLDLGHGTYTFSEQCEIPTGISRKNEEGQITLNALVHDVIISLRKNSVMEPLDSSPSTSGASSSEQRIEIVAGIELQGAELVDESLRQSISEGQKMDRPGSSTKEQESEVLDELKTLWEIEITRDARSQWDLLDAHDSRLVAVRLQRLAQGRWSGLVRQTSHVKAIKLFRTDFSKGGRIIWELAVSYCACYSEVIRVWAIVADHDKQSLAIQRIQESHRKGRTSNSRIDLREYRAKNSKPLKDTDGSPVRGPRLFVEEKVVSSSHIRIDDVEDEGSLFMWYPPAVPSADSYVLLKFYECTSVLLRKYFSDQHVATLAPQITCDFPFRLSPTEHEVCNISPSDPCSLLVLGRSGTGKTTCLGFRMWFHYKVWMEKFSGKDDLLTEGTQHLNQVFLTANAVLRSEVRMFFRSLLAGEKGRSFAVDDHVLDCGLDSPTLEQNHSESLFPLFLTKREWLVLLDGTLKNPFFHRSAGELISNGAWGRVEHSGLYELSECFVEEDNENSEDDYDVDLTEQPSYRNENGDFNGLLEIDYDYFAAKIWSRLSKHRDFSALLLWCEFTSFIKGSAESMLTGALTAEQYDRIGRKRAPNFKNCRHTIYGQFMEYESIRRRLKGFDLCDLVYHILNELRLQARAHCGACPNFKNGYTGIPLHELYVDEVQDFMESEILLMATVADPNCLFLTGDDAQTIARGLSFRFSDVKSIFWNLHEGNSTVGVPKVYTLKNNYRTHSGILNLANSVIDLISHFFPGSVDKLPHDRGLFDGPKPWLLQAAKFEDLCLLLLGSDRDSQIEFGAQQCVIVRDSESKRRIPDDLSRGGIVCSVFETKEIWRCVISAINDIAVEESSNAPDSIGLEELQLNESNKSDSKSATPSLAYKSSIRPLQFNGNQHKILLEELRHLYTAVTRARVNIWIYDESEELRAPMFEFFGAKNLVRVVESVLGLEELGITKGALTSQDEWIAQGGKLFEKGAFHLAYTCFSKGKNQIMADNALANALARSPAPANESNAERTARYIRASKLFLLSRERSKTSIHDAAACLRRGHEYRLAADLFFELNRPYLSAKCFEEGSFYFNAGKRFLDCSKLKAAVRCFLKCNKADAVAGAKVLMDRGGGKLAVDLLIKLKLNHAAYSMLKDFPSYGSAAQRSSTMSSLALLCARESVVEKKKESVIFEWFDCVLTSDLDRLVKDLKCYELFGKYLLCHKHDHSEGLKFLTEKKLYSTADKLILAEIEHEHAVDNSSTVLDTLIRWHSRFLAHAGLFHDAGEALISSYSVAPELRRILEVEDLTSQSLMTEQGSNQELEANRCRILKGHVMVFLNSKMGWYVFWALFRVACAGIPLASLFPPSEPNNVTALINSLKLIKTTVAKPDGNCRSSLWEIENSILIPGSVKFDSLSYRVLSFTAGMIDPKPEMQDISFTLACSNVEMIWALTTKTVHSVLCGIGLKEYINCLVSMHYGRDSTDLENQSFDVKSAHDKFMDGCTFIELCESILKECIGLTTACSDKKSRSKLKGGTYSRFNNDIAVASTEIKQALTVRFVEELKMVVNRQPVFSRLPLSDGAFVLPNYCQFALMSQLESRGSILRRSCSLIIDYLRLNTSAVLNYLISDLCLIYAGLQVAPVVGEKKITVFFELLKEHLRISNESLSDNNQSSLFTLKKVLQVSEKFLGQKFSDPLLRVERTIEFFGALQTQFTIDIVSLTHGINILEEAISIFIIYFSEYFCFDAVLTSSVTFSTLASRKSWKQCGRLIDIRVPETTQIKQGTKATVLRRILSKSSVFAGRKSSTAASNRLYSILNGALEVLLIAVKSVLASSASTEIGSKMPVFNRLIACIFTIQCNLQRQRAVLSNMPRSFPAADDHEVKAAATIEQFDEMWYQFSLRLREECKDIAIVIAELVDRLPSVSFPENFHTPGVVGVTSKSQLFGENMLLSLTVSSIQPFFSQSGDAIVDKSLERELVLRRTRDTAVCLIQAIYRGHFCRKTRLVRRASPVFEDTSAEQQIYENWSQHLYQLLFGQLEVHLGPQTNITQSVYYFINELDLLGLQHGHSDPFYWSIERRVNGVMSWVHDISEAGTKMQLLRDSISQLISVLKSPPHSEHSKNTYLVLGKKYQTEDLIKQLQGTVDRINYQFHQTIEIFGKCIAHGGFQIGYRELKSLCPEISDLSINTFHADTMMYLENADAVVSAESKRLRDSVNSNNDDDIFQAKETSRKVGNDGDDSDYDDAIDDEDGAGDGLFELVTKSDCRGGSAKSVMSKSNKKKNKRKKLVSRR